MNTKKLNNYPIDTYDIVTRRVKKKKTMEEVSFRVESSTMETLRDESQRRKTRINTLVNQIFIDYLAWDRHAPETGWVPMQRYVLIKLVDMLNEKTIIDLGKKAAEGIGGDILSMGGRYDIEGLLAKIKIRAKKSAFHIREEDEDTNLEIIMHHNLGWKWSIFFKAYYEELFRKFSQKAIIDFTENILVINLPRDKV